MDVFAVTETISERYRRYLTTTFHFKDPKLRSSFENALSAGPLWRGPYIEATPPYRIGSHSAALFEELLTGDVEDAFLTAISGDRSLYRHQEEAIRRVTAGHNVVVATGTGSGKTECFLYPILLHLYRAHLNGELTARPGVRALVLYPMNALVYDQRDRLGEICRTLDDNNADFRFSFGQYTGATPEDERDRYRNAEQIMADQRPGELVLRREMRENPPHILLTNFSMLEYQLLRPLDSPLFDGEHGTTWSYLVLDEAHQYRGSRGAEMGLLVRRLKQRITDAGHDGSFRCIATSATLAGGAEDRAEVANFAAELFGEPFEAEDVILADAEAPSATRDDCLPPEIYATLAEALKVGDAEQIAATIKQAENTSPSGTHDSGLDDGNGPVGQKLSTLLAGDARVLQLRAALENGPEELHVLADRLFSDHIPAERARTLGDFISLLAGIRAPSGPGSFLSLRYHFFLRALEGAYISYVPTREIRLTPGGDKSSRVFEIALCRECGQHYIVGRLVGGYLVEAVRDPGNDDFSVSFFLPLDSDDLLDLDEASDALRCCAECGRVSQREGALDCGHDVTFLLVPAPSAQEHEDRMPSCRICSYSGVDPVREVIHGGDGPHAMLATALYQWLHEENPNAAPKILAFSDSRQEAAYFPWYLDKTYLSVMRRSLLWRIIGELHREFGEDLSLTDLVDTMQGRVVQFGIVGEAASRHERRRAAWLEVYRELLTPELRLSLAGVGLVRWSMQWPSALTIPDFLQQPPWGLSQGEARSLVFLLLDSLRLDRAVKLTVQGIDDITWNDLDIEGRQRAARMGTPGGDTSIISWSGKKGRRVDYLAKVLRRNGLTDDQARQEAERSLNAVWQHFCNFAESQTGDEQLLCRTGDARRLNPVWWRVAPVGEGVVLYQCDTCGRVDSTSVRGVCSRYRCPGSLVVVEPETFSDNHYRRLYESDLPGRMISEEHTAQLSYDRAREIQRRFQRGQINVLSSSTTFELGVDLGDLNTVMLRNVPPEPFNYVQRVGRAGRRAGSPGLAVTYCRRGPHDLYHFADPGRMIAGRTQPPKIALDNVRIAERHLAAVVLSAFFRHHSGRFKSVESLVGDWTRPSMAGDVRHFVEENLPTLAACARACLPEALWAKLGLEGEEWVEDVAGEGSRLAHAEAGVVADHNRLVTIETMAKEAGNYTRAGWAQKRRRTVAHEYVLNFLSRNAVIPKYGFPVDVVELDTRVTDDAGHVSLSRDLAIAIGEFAPGATLIADKKEWESAGLKTVPERALEIKSYKVCRQHNVLVSWAEGEDEPDLPCGDKAILQKYVIPAFGFISSGARRIPRGRPRRMFTTRPYFLRATGPEPEAIEILDTSEHPVATIYKAVPARMGVLCEGRRGDRFYICMSCGAGFAGPKRTHSSPWGLPCNGTLRQLALGHEFETDVVQVQFHMRSGVVEENDSLWLGYGLACALIEGLADQLDVPSTDLNTTVGRSKADAFPTIVLYDDVPGGAGLVARVEEPDVFHRCLAQAHRRVSGVCGCGEEASCYGCLRSYRNQFAHPHLRRGAVRSYLEQVLDAIRT